MKINLKIFIQLAFWILLMYFLIILTDTFGWIGFIILILSILFVYFFIKIALLIKKKLDNYEKK